MAKEHSTRFRDIAFSNGTPKKAFLTACVVGTILTAINHGDVISCGSISTTPEGFPNLLRAVLCDHLGFLFGQKEPNFEAERGCFALRRSLSFIAGSSLFVDQMSAKISCASAEYSIAMRLNYRGSRQTAFQGAHRPKVY